MIRKPTIILLVLLALLIALALYLQKNPLPGASGSATPSPTAPAQVFAGMNSSNISEVSLQAAGGTPVTVTRDSGGAWTLAGGDLTPGEKAAADPAKAEQLRAEIAAMRSLAVLPADADLAAFGLQPPAYLLTVRAGGEAHEVRIGKETSIGTGYYTQVDGKQAQVADKGPIDTITSLMEDMKAPETTPTTGGIVTPALPAPAP